jgi:hypothetical protein
MEASCILRLQFAMPSLAVAVLQANAISPQ